MPGWRLFGYKLGEDQPLDPNKKTFSLPINDDGAVVTAVGGIQATYVDFDGQSAKNEVELITKYREMSLTPETSAAIDDIVNEAIVMEENKPPISLVTDNLNYDESFKGKLRDEFEHIIKLLDFNNIGYEIFRRWYVDGRLYFHIIIDETKPDEGIQELRYLDPRKVRKIREVKKSIDRITGSEIVQDVQEYFIYNERGLQTTSGIYSPGGMAGTRISPDSICYVHSGLIDSQYNSIVSYLHKAIKPLNQLRMIEDSLIIYRISRAPERRVFYVDVGQLPKGKAEAYVNDLMQRYRTRLVYDSNTGEVQDNKRHMSMLEDFWLPRREGGKGTEVSTLSGGQNLGELTDVNFFQDKLYKALNIPVSRLKQETGFNLGKSSEIQRDEIKFGKFIYRLRIRFSQIFDVLLRSQLILKGIITKEDWDNIRKDIIYEFQKDSYFSELKNLEILSNRIQTLTSMSEYIKRYYSEKWVRKNVLMQSEDEILEQDNQIAKEGLPDLPAGSSIGMPVGIPGTDYAPPQYASQAAQYDQVIGADPASQVLKQQQAQQQAQEFEMMQKQQAAKSVDTAPDKKDDRSGKSTKTQILKGSPRPKENQTKGVHHKG